MYPGLRRHLYLRQAVHNQTMEITTLTAITRHQGLFRLCLVPTLQVSLRRLDLRKIKEKAPRTTLCRACRSRENRWNVRLRHPLRKRRPRNVLRPCRLHLNKLLRPLALRQGNLSIYHRERRQ